jgi:hypothetical protein
MSASSGRDTIFDWPVTGSGTLGTVTVAARDVADLQPFIAPATAPRWAARAVARRGAHGRCHDSLAGRLPPAAPAKAGRAGALRYYHLAVVTARRVLPLCAAEWCGFQWRGAACNWIIGALWRALIKLI